MPAHNYAHSFAVNSPGSYGRDEGQAHNGRYACSQNEKSSWLRE